MSVDINTPCIHGHIGRRSPKDGKCLECGRLRRVPGQTVMKNRPYMVKDPRIDKLYRMRDKLNIQWNLKGKDILEVDHIIPRNGQRVCGLHTFDNLQLLSKSLNVKKGFRKVGDKCKRGHIRNKLGRCYECSVEDRKAYYQRNKERYKERANNWMDSNKERYKEIHRDYAARQRAGATK